MLLRFKIDENLPRRVEPALLALGHDVETAISEHLNGAPDADLLTACRRENRILVTLDLDFSDIRLYPPGTHAGIWVLRPATQAFDDVLSLVLSAVKLAQVERTSGQLWVIDPRRVRIRD